MAKRGSNADTCADVVRTTPDAADTEVRVATLDTDGLLAFFEARGRDLPWRRPNVDGWGVLVSEVMLQQTPVARVLPVYDEWLRRWPTPASLAQASTGDVVRAWGRLGYPRRALRLREAAIRITDHHDGSVPDDVAALLRLPGVGEYTARAVAAFAFGHRHPVVDTNVRRVLCRAVRGVDEHGPATAADRAELENLLPPEPHRAARTSAALMELGALVCTSISSDCHACPLAETCAWRAAGYPPGPDHRRPAQRWHGTDRKMRGEILAVLRAQHAPLRSEDLAAATPSYEGNEDQWQRCLASLLRDGLAAEDSTGRIGLP